MDHKCKASEMYSRSAQFRSQVKLFELAYDAWAILSTEYGLITPDTIIKPYNKNLCNSNSSRLNVTNKITQQELDV